MVPLPVTTPRLWPKVGETTLSLLLITVLNTNMLLISTVTTLSIITLAPFGPPEGQGGEVPTGVQIVGSDQLPS